MSASPHLTPAAFDFLKGLARHNDRTWFNKRKSIFKTELKEPMLALIEAINDGFRESAPEFVRPPAKCLMRIYRDIRFSKDKSPYKIKLSAWWARSGLEKTSGSGFFLQIGVDKMLVAAGVYMPEAAQLSAIRHHLLEHLPRYRALSESRKMRAKFVPFDGLRLIRPPKGFPADHPATEVIKQRQFGVSCSLPASLALDKTCSKEILARFRLALPLVTFLNEPLVGKPRKPIF